MSQILVALALASALSLAATSFVPPSDSGTSECERVQVHGLDFDNDGAPTPATRQLLGLAVSEVASADPRSALVRTCGPADDAARAVRHRLLDAGITEVDHRPSPELCARVPGEPVIIEPDC